MAPMKRPADEASQGYYRGTWSLGEAARRLGVNKKELRCLLADGQLDFVQIARQIRIPAEHVQQRIRSSDWPSPVRHRVRIP